MHTLETLPFVDGYAHLPESFHTPVQPTPLQGARLLHFNADAAGLIGLTPGEGVRRTLVRMLNGEEPLPGATPTAALYAGHQFGHYVPQLGDGRAILLGEVQGPDGRRWELQTKGAGLTAYSRQGDGRAVLRSSVREYLCSEAMHGLGIPTTRALCLIDSDEPVFRERRERGALLLRMAPSHLRFGSFEVFYYRGQFERLRTLARFAVERHFPELLEATDPALAMFQEVVRRTAQLVAQWQLVGFAHGVMNTDNMSLLGLTLDYGPYAFLDRFDPGFVCNRSDHTGRYAFDRQPAIAQWNLSCLGQALLPLFDAEPEAAAEAANEALAAFEGVFARAYRDGMGAKLGLERPGPDDDSLIGRLLERLAENGADYTGFFRELARFDPDRPAATLPPGLKADAAGRAWAEDYARRLREEQRTASERRAAMLAVNPKFVLRNHLAAEAIAAAEAGDTGPIERLLQVLQTPFEEHPEHQGLAAPPPPGCDDLRVSCSS